MIKSTKQLIEEARELIKNPDNWCQEAFSRDKTGKPVSSWKEEAIKFCAIGALYRVSPYATDKDLFSKIDPDSLKQKDNHNNTFDVLQKTSKRLFGQLVQNINDTTGHADIMKIYDETIKELNEQELAAKLISEKPAEPGTDLKTPEPSK